MTMKIYNCLCLAALLLAAACKESERGVPVSTTDVAPGPVSDIQVENIAGGATISYALPKSSNLLYVLAEYRIREGGELLEKKSSYYNNSLTIEGFPDTLARQVTLYAVSKGEKRSEPVEVTVHPGQPPIKLIKASVQMKATFGGVQVSFVNENEADVKITVLTTDSVGDLYPADVYYTKRKEGNFSVRGFAAEERTFGVFVRDRWDNFSDTVYSTLTPYYEEEITKSLFSAVHLPTDTYTQHCCGNGMTDVWDDVWGPGDVFHTKPNTGMPQWFTFDMGQSVLLSRLKLYHRNTSAGTDGAFYGGDPKRFEIWGSNDPNPDGSWDSWTLLGSYECLKPSGSAKPTAEDIAYACEDGEDFEFPLGIPPVRYLRFRTLETWGGTTYIYIAELSFWGDVQ